MTGRIILLRHGQTFSNIDRIMDTRPPGAELTERGRGQAEDVGRELAELCAGRRVRFVCSIALRAQQTAMLAARAFGEAADERNVPVEVRVGLHEVFAGEHEMSGSEDTHREYMVALRGWLDGDAAARMPGGESYTDVLDRYQPVLEDIAAELEDDEDIVVVSHGAAIRVVTTHACGVDPDFAYTGYMPNCRFTLMEPQRRPFGQWMLKRWADTEV
ncbi:histidine phosphatase family protein [uncultured Corynebacterium sp.]|uniref:histidine phosphatase family protein n=1 Tax=uncultured Corynebacterium sp. TaxID=159447 RepID=UPI0025F9CFFB|nr:histidine phosphatase family protein [uncultured Corynebacterium sp.]